MARWTLVPTRACFWALVAVAWSASPSLVAQAPQAEPQSPVRIWVFGGLGATDFGGLAAGAGANVGIGAWHVGGRYSANGGPPSEEEYNFLLTSTMRDEMYEAGVIGGRTIRVSSAGQLLLSAGVGQVRVRRVVPCEDLCFFGTGSYEEQPARIGLMLEALLVADVARVVGVALAGRVNLNGEQSFVAVTVDLALGLIR